MLELLKKYASIIVSWRLTRYEQCGSSLRLRMEIEFVDGSRLYIRETVLEGKERRYAYHWQSKDQELLTRWDNAPDWEVETFPHHKHVGMANRVEPSYERTLEQVLRVIAQKLGSRPN